MELSQKTKERLKTLLAEKPQQDPYRRFTILAYQLADVGKCMRYMEIYPDERSGYVSYLKTALADLLVQTAIVTQLYGFTLSELEELGEQRLDEFKKKARYVEVE